jgi:hypothetical protein
MIKNKIGIALAVAVAIAIPAVSKTSVVKGRSSLSIIHNAPPIVCPGGRLIVGPAKSVICQLP